MTVIVSVKINDGIVMAADSASTFTNSQVYELAEKIVNLVKGMPIGVMVTGGGGIGSESADTHRFRTVGECHRGRISVRPLAGMLPNESWPAVPPSQIEWHPRRGRTAQTQQGSAW